MDLKYRLNEYRQQIVFYKDLYRHYLKYGIHFDRTGQDRTGQDRTGQDRTLYQKLFTTAGLAEVNKMS